MKKVGEGEKPPELALLFTNRGAKRVELSEDENNDGPPNRPAFSDDPREPGVLVVFMTPEFNDQGISTGEKRSAMAFPVSRGETPEAVFNELGQAFDKDTKGKAPNISMICYHYSGRKNEFQFEQVTSSNVYAQKSNVIPIKRPDEKDFHFDPLASDRPPRESTPRAVDRVMSASLRY